MNFNKLQFLIKLIESRGTGTPAELARKLNMSERMIYKYIYMLKYEFNAPIAYSRSMKSYYFSENGSLNLYWKKES
jgi:transcriptional antiterminator